MSDSPKALKGEEEAFIIKTPLTKYLLGVPVEELEAVAVEDRLAHAIEQQDTTPPPEGGPEKTQEVVVQEKKTDPSPKEATTVFNMECLQKKDIGSFIGKGASNINFNVMRPSRKMFDAWKKKEKIQDVKKHDLYVKIFSEEDVVKCHVASSSPELLRFAVFSVKKAEKTLNIRILKHTFYASMNHPLIPLFIGHKGKSIQTFLKRTSNDVPEIEFQAGNPFRRVNRGDTSISIEEARYYDDASEKSIESSSQELIDRIDQDKYSDFVGWPPSTEEYEEFVEITLSSYMTLDDFLSLKTHISEKLNDYIGFIEKKNEKRSRGRESIDNDMMEALAEEH
tara:strand:- start:308 stop:1321 length:1014 start_codon:yes stop_codon:yes gene_type:complete